MALMVGLGVLLVSGLIATGLWVRRPYVGWAPRAPEEPTARSRAAAAAKRYLRGVAVGWIAGVFAGGLVTGPAMRLIMRLLAVTAGDGAQGAVTEADQVVGRISFGETFGLYVFGGLLPGVISGLAYVLVRRFLPQGWRGPVIFGLLHLVLLATRVDPLRPGNEDFDIVGPGWLAVLTFGLSVVAHGVAVAAIANRVSAGVPPSRPATGRRWLVVIGTSVPPGLVLVLGIAFLVPLGIGLIIAVVVGLLPAAIGRVMSGRRVTVGVAAAIAVLALVALPGTVRDLLAIVDRPAPVRAAADQ